MEHVFAYTTDQVSGEYARPAFAYQFQSPSGADGFFMSRMTISWCPADASRRVLGVPMLKVRHSIDGSLSPTHGTDYNGTNMTGLVQDSKTKMYACDPDLNALVHCAWTPTRENNVLTLDLGENLFHVDPTKVLSLTFDPSYQVLGEVKTDNSYPADYIITFYIREPEDVS